MSWFAERNAENSSRLIWQNLTSAWFGTSSTTFWVLNPGMGSFSRWYKTTVTSLPYITFITYEIYLSVPLGLDQKMCPTFKDCDFHNIGYCFPVWSRTVHGKPVGQCNSDHMYTCELFSDGKGKLGLRQEILHVVNHTHKKINTAYVFIKVFYLREYLSHLICKHG